MTLILILLNSKNTIMLKFVLFLLIYFAIILIENGAVDKSELQKDISYQLLRRNGTELSRKKRYLVFPAGSSFQLVFCLTYPSLGVGSYFVFGHTAALAWELPSTPLTYTIKDFEKKAEEEANAETTTTEMPHDVDLSALDHGDSDHHRLSTDFLPWNSLHQNTYQKIDNGYSKWPTNSYNREPVSIYNNPFLKFIKTSKLNTLKRPLYQFAENRDNPINGNLKKDNNYGKTYSEHVRSYNKNTNFQRYDSRESQLTAHIDPMYYSIHRRTRRDLYKKIENFLTALNVDGKVCILKAICEVTKSSNQKGSFMEEILKAIFRTKPHEEYPNEDTYDQAANATHNCDELYPTCKGSVWRNLFLFQK